MKTKKIRSTYRIATTEDFKRGLELFADDLSYSHILADKYSEGIWNTNGSNVIFENEAKYYKVQIK